MAYIGGKARGSDHITSLLNHRLFNGMDYLEPFVGYAHILRRVERKNSYRASDCNELLVTLLKGVQNGERFPNISKREYDSLRYETNDHSFRRAVAAFAYSYKGGEWRGYFNKRRDRSYADEHKRYHELLFRNSVFQNTRLSCTDYRRLIPREKLIYCDPPYKGTTGYNDGAVFNHDEFWDYMRRWSQNNIVFVSEYHAPRDFKCIAKREKNNNLASNGAPEIRVECVFVHESLVHLLSQVRKDMKSVLNRQT